MEVGEGSTFIGICHPKKPICLSPQKTIQADSGPLGQIAPLRSRRVRCSPQKKDQKSYKPLVV